MFFISGTYEGNFIRSDCRIKRPTDLSFFDFQNYPDALPLNNNNPNLIIQKVSISNECVTSSHLMIAICVNALDKFGRKGFFSCRELSDEDISSIDTTTWFNNNIRKLYHYLIDSAPIENDAITHLPDITSSETMDLSGLINKFNPSTIIKWNLNWLTKGGIKSLHQVLNDRLFSINDFTLICGLNDNFPDEIHEEISDMLEEQKIKKHQADILRENKKKALRQANFEYERWKRRWDEIAQLAEGIALICMIMLPVIYFLVNLFSSNESSGPESSSFDPIVYLCWISIIFASSLTLYKIIAVFIQDRF